MASGQTLLSFSALSNTPPGTGNSVIGTLNGQPVLNHATAVSSNSIFPSVMPRNFSGSLGNGITVNLYWTGDAAPGGQSVVWSCDWENDAAGQPVNLDNFNTGGAQTVTTPAPTQGQIVVSTLNFTWAQIGSILPGSRFRFRVMRTGSGSDNFSGDAQLVAVELKDR
jgi:hypothetical protein